MKKSFLLAALMLPTMALAQQPEPQPDVQTVNMADEMALLNDSIVQLNSFIQTQLDTIAAKDQRIALLEMQCSEQQAQLHALDNLSATIYKQCLLYPLESRYNPQGLQEAIQCLNELNVWDNPLYKANCDVYRPMLTSYGRYNTQLIEMLEEFQQYLQRKEDALGRQYQMNSMEEGEFMQTLRQLEYFRYYSRRNNPPYQSILYLDNIIDRLANIVSNHEGISVQTLGNIIDRLRPRQN